MGLPAVEFEDPFGHVVKEIAVVRHGEHSSGILRQMLLKPHHTLGVQMVRRLVEQQEIRLLEQEFAQCNTPAFATAELVDDDVRRWTAECIHGLLQSRIEVPRVRMVQIGLQITHFGKKRVVIGIRLSEFLADLVEAIELRLDGGDSLFDVFEDCLAFRQRRLLLEHANGGIRIDDRIAVADVVKASHDL